MIIATLVMTACDDSNEIAAPFGSLGGAYSADFVLPCGSPRSADVVMTQQASTAIALIPGFGKVECKVAQTGHIPRVTAATLSLDVGCGGTNVTYERLPTDDGGVLTWDFPDGRGENCGCSGTTSIRLHMAPR